MSSLGELLPCSDKSSSSSLPGLRLPGATDSPAFLLRRQPLEETPAKSNAARLEYSKRPNATPFGKKKRKLSLSRADLG